MQFVCVVVVVVVVVVWLLLLLLFLFSVDVFFNLFEADCVESICYSSKT